MGAFAIIQIIWFVITNIPTAIKLVQAIGEFIKAHRKHPQYKEMVQGFGVAAEAAKLARDPKPLEDFFAQLKVLVDGAK